MLLRASTTLPLTDGFVIVAHALDYAQALSEFAVSQLYQFGTQQVGGFRRAERALTQVSSAGKDDVPFGLL
jgi:hypothetical protein